MMMEFLKEGTKNNLMANKVADVAQNIVMPLITGAIALFTAAKGAQRILCEKK